MIKFFFLVIPFSLFLLIFFSSPSIAQEKSDSGIVSKQKSDTITELSSPIDSINFKKDNSSLISQKDDSIHKEKNSILNETEEELILDGGEEHIIFPTSIETLLPKSNANDSLKLNPISVSSDSSTTSSLEPATNDNLLPAIPKIPVETAQTVRIEKLQSINFARNYKEYRSLKTAILLSLLVPGAGEAYAHNILRTGIFGVIEVAIISAGTIVGLNGKKKWNEAHNFANNHFRIADFNFYYEKLMRYNPGADSIVFGTFDSVPTILLDAEAKNQNYYDCISREVSPYIQGWDDVKPKFDDNFNLIDDENGIYFQHSDNDSLYLVFQRFENGDTSLAQYGFSENQKIYNRQLSKANSYIKWSGRLITLLILNHIFSAIDAGITAKAYNDKLLGKNSFWQKINIKENYVNNSSGTYNGFSLEVRF